MTIIKSFFRIRPVRKDVPLRTARLGIIAVILSQALDYISTTVGIYLGATEQNSLMASIVGNWWLFLAIKVVATSFLCWAVWKRPLACLLISTLYLLVGLNNLYVIYNLA